MSTQFAILATESKMADLIVRNGTVITMDRERRVIEDGAVAIAGDRIIDVGPSAAVLTRHSASKTIDARHKAVIPGLIDVHGHAGHTIVKTMGGGIGKDWLTAVQNIYALGSGPEYWQADALLSALERLKGGVTCGLSILGGGYVMRVDDPIYADVHSEAYVKIGVRNMLAVGPTPPPYPSRFARWDGESNRSLVVSFEDQLAITEKIVGKWHGAGGGAIHVALAAPTYKRENKWDQKTIDDWRDQARAVRAISRRAGAIFTQDGHLGGSIKAAHEMADLLGPDALLSHCIDLFPEEIELLRATDTKIAHNPSANMAIRGRCPVPELIDAGVTVAIGSDGTSPDRSYDMFRHMFQCMHYHRTHFHDSAVLTVAKVLEMVTIDAAKAMGLDGSIGSLETGKKADVVLVDLRKPHLMPLNMPIYRLACFANAADVDTVIVDGKIAMESRRVATVDEDDVLDFVQRETDRMIARTGLGAMLAPPPRFWGATHY